MDGYVTKPIIREEVAAVLDRYLPVALPVSSLPERGASDVSGTPTPSSDGPSGEAAPPDDIIDPARWEALRALERSSGPGLLGQLVETFLAGAAGHVADLVDPGATSGDGMRRIAHTLRGSASTIGARRLAQLLERVERAGAADAGAAADIVAEFQRVRGALAPWTADRGT